MKIITFGVALAKNVFSIIRGRYDARSGLRSCRSCQRAWSARSAYRCAAQTLVAFAFAWLSALALGADDYPSKPVRIIVPYSAGSTGDLRTRQLAQYLTGRLAQPVLVENKPGASGILGAKSGAHAAPDGYTLLYMSNPRVMVPHLNKDVGIDVFKDLAPIVLMANGASVLVANASVPASSVKELVALAKSRPQLLSYGSSGVGSVQHAPMEMFKRMAGIEILHVPYKGDAETLTALLSGNVSLSFAGSASVLPSIAAGRLKPLAVGGKRRLEALPNVPTMSESGYPDFEWHNWYGYAAPAKTPRPIIDKLNQAMTAYLALPRTKQELRDIGFEAVGGAPEELAAVMQKDYARYGELFRKIGLEAQ